MARLRPAARLAVPVGSAERSVDRLGTAFRGSRWRYSDLGGQGLVAWCAAAVHDAVLWL